MMKTKYFLPIMLILFNLLRPNVFAQQEDTNILDKPIEEITINNTNMTTILVEISDKYDIPIGFEYSDFEHTEKIKIGLNKRNTTVKNVLNSLIAQNPNYKWELSEGVINFTPTKSRRKSLERLLATEINLTNNKSLTKYQLKSFLAELPEIRKISDSMFNFKIYSDNDSDQMLSDEVFNPTKIIQFKSFLNRIVKGRDSNFWFISELGNKERIFNLEF